MVIPSSRRPQRNAFIRKRWLATVSHAGWLRIWSVPQAPETNDSLQRQPSRTLGMRHDEESGEPRALTAAEWTDVGNVGQR